LTLKDGFIAGALVGAIAWFLIVGPNASGSLSPDTILSGKNFAGLLFLLSFFWTPLGIMIGRAPGGTGVTGFLFGFAFGYDLPFYLLNLSKGQLPSS
jgi:hypothetical protein